MGNRLGNDDGAVDRHYRTGEFGQCGCPGVGGKHDAVRSDTGTGCAHLHGLTGTDGGHSSVLVDLHTVGQRYPSHSAYQQSGLNGGVAAFEDPCQMHAGACSPGHLIGIDPLEWAHTQPLTGSQRRVPGIEVSWSGGGPQPTCLPVMGVDLVLLAELPEFGNGTLGLFAQEACLVGIAEAHEGSDLGPPGHDESSIASGCTAATDILLDQHDARLGLHLLDGKGCPKPDEATTDDEDIDLVLASQRSERALAMLDGLHPIAGLEGRGKR